MRHLGHDILHDRHLVVEVGAQVIQIGILQTSTELAERAECRFSMPRGHHVVLRHLLQAVGGSDQPVHDRPRKPRVDDQELRRLAVGIEPADRSAGRHRGHRSRAARPATGVPPWVSDAEATSREVMSTCSRDRPIDMNCQPSSRTMMPREMPANMALRSRAQFKNTWAPVVPNGVGR